MKIAFLHMTMGLVERGSEVSTHLLAQELSRRNQVVVYQSGPLGKNKYGQVMVAPLSEAPLVAPRSMIEKALFRVHWDRNSRLVNWFTRLAARQLIADKPDLVVCVNGHVQLGIINKVLPQVKTVVFGRAGIGYHDKATLLEKPDVFIALSEEAKTWAEINSPFGLRIEFVPNPVDLEAFAKARPVRLGMKAPVILAVGALTDYKNVDLVIKAVAKNKQSLLVIGDGERRDKIKSLMKRMLGKRGKLITNVSYRNLPSYFKSADIFCLVPDEQEAFGRVFIEAMAAGLPVVTSKDKIREEIVGDMGIYVENFDVDEIVRGLDKAMKLGKPNYDEKLKNYSLEKVAGDVEKIFMELVPGKG